MDPTLIASELMRSVVCGVSKTQALHTLRKRYNLTDQQLDQIVYLCSFKHKPKQIDYKSFAARKFPIGTEQFKFPFTQLYQYRNFLSKDECEQIINISEGSLRPSTVANPADTGLISDYRTSKTADLSYFGSEYMHQLNCRICSFMNLNFYLGETLQAQKYNPGQYYKEHCDYFFPLTKEFKTYTEWMGQRTWTFMLYLNDVEEGGETYFKHLKLKVKPEQGKAVFWNNLFKNGVPNPKTMHEALPPRSGDKYVVTKWFRSWSLI